MYLMLSFVKVTLIYQDHKYVTFSDISQHFQEKSHAHKQHVCLHRGESDGVVQALSLL